MKEVRRQDLVQGSLLDHQRVEGPQPEPVWTTLEKEACLRVSTQILPAMPVPDTSKWNTRPAEILGFHSYLDQLTAWIGMMRPEFSKDQGQLRAVACLRVRKKGVVGYTIF